MSKTPSEWEIGTDEHREAPVGSAEPNPPAPGSRTLQAGDAFLRALAGDLATITSRLRLATRRRPRRPRPVVPHPVSDVPGIGRMVWRLSVVLFGILSICAGALSVITLWVLFGFSPEPQKRDANSLAAQFEARRSEPVAATAPLNVTGAKRVEAGTEPAAPAPSEAAATSTAVAASGSSTPGTSDAKATSEATPPATSAGTDQPQLARLEPLDRAPAVPQQAVSVPLAASPVPAQCNVELCTATYRSFHATDCTYQPHGGGPRQICALNAHSADARPQTPRAPEKPESAATPTGAAGQCNVDACATRYASFHAADCTYQPLGGGPRQMCELSARSTDARAQTREAADKKSTAKHTRVAESEDDNSDDGPVAATPARAAGQCNVDACSDAYASFHAADCTYQPRGGGPRQICEQ